MFLDKTKGHAFVNRVAFDDNLTADERSRHLHQTLADFGWTLVTILYMSAVVLLMGWAFGH